MRQRGQKLPQFFLPHIHHLLRSNHETFHHVIHHRLAGLRACGLALLVALAPSVWAQCVYFDAFKVSGDGTITDPRDGLVWSRCAVGQTWNGEKCDGAFARLTWFEAMKIAKSTRSNGHEDWRLPSPTELSEIGIRHAGFVACRPAGRSVSSLFGNEPSVAWSYKADLSQDGSGKAAAFSFYHSGFVEKIDANSTIHARLVRAGRLSNSDEFAVAFTEVEKNDQRVRQKAADTSKRYADSERQRQQFEAQRLKEESEFNALLRSPSPRTMYLSAVKLEDSGDRGKAKTVYRELMRRFPNAQETLLASQRLTRLGDVEAVESASSSAAARTESAAQGLRSQNYQQCMAEESSCYSRCSDIRNSSAASSCSSGCFKGCKQ